jgi:PIN domain nuclease of toxin-antitoxin system
MLKMSRTAKYLLDTHVFVWLMLENQHLKKRSILETAAITGGLLVSPITCWEVGMLASRRRINLRMPTQDWIEQALTTPGLSLLELSARIAVEASYLPGKPHGDPVDRILIATARIKGLTLATRDEKILGYSEQGYVNTIAC